MASFFGFMDVVAGSGAFFKNPAHCVGYTLGAPEKNGILRATRYLPTWTLMQIRVIINGNKATLPTATSREANKAKRDLEAIITR